MDFLSIIISKNKITKKNKQTKARPKNVYSDCAFQRNPTRSAFTLENYILENTRIFLSKKNKKKRLFTGNPDILSLPLCATWKGFFISNRYRGKRNKAIISCCICYIYISSSALYRAYIGPIYVSYTNFTITNLKYTPPFFQPKVVLDIIYYYERNTETFSAHCLRTPLRACYWHRF